MTSATSRPQNFQEYFETSAPGVYLQDEFPRPEGAAFATGVPAFLGMAPPGYKETAPVLLTLWFHFRQTFGEPLPGSDLAYAVRGYFENGGRACYVVPLSANTKEGLAAGLESIAKLNTVDLVCVPDAGKNGEQFLDMQQQVMDHCGSLGDRFAILDTRGGVDSDAVAEQWSGLDGYNGAIYYPWIKVQGLHGGMVTVPPCGHVAGIYARVDRLRGVHKAPANEVLEEVRDLERRLNDCEQAELNSRRVNCLRSFPGRGIRVWGARTLSGHDRWTYVNVRRLFLTTVRWIDWHMQYVAFEPNNSTLWAHVEHDLQNYFYSLYRAGALKGRTAQEAFYVKCNQETNTAETLSRSEVVVELGLAPAVPFEFIVVRLVRGVSGVRTAEVGQ